MIKIHDLADLGVRHAPEKRLIKLSRLAGGANDQALPVLVQQAPGEPGIAVKIIDMGAGNQAVQVGPPDIVFCQNNDMVGRELFDPLVVHCAQLVQPVHMVHAPLPQHLQEHLENLRRTARVVHGPVMVLQGNV